MKKIFNLCFIMNFVASIILFSCHPTEGIVVPNPKQMETVSQRIADEDAIEYSKEVVKDFVKTLHYPLKNELLCGFLYVKQGKFKNVFKPNDRNKKFVKSMDTNGNVSYDYLNYKEENSEFTLLGTLTLKREQNMVTVSGNIYVSFPHGAHLKFDNLVVSDDVQTCGELESIQSGRIIYSYPAGSKLPLILSKIENPEIMENFLKIRA